MTFLFLTSPSHLKSTTNKKKVQKQCKILTGSEKEKSTYGKQNMCHHQTKASSHTFRPLTTQVHAMSHQQPAKRSEYAAPSLRHQRLRVAPLA